METRNDAVRQHYQAAIPDQSALIARIRELVDDLKGPITASNLASFDQFHAGGLAATSELGRRAGVQPGMLVLDAGSGLGGPSRYLAETFKCRVEGVDLSPDYVAVAELLTERAGLADRLRYHVGDLIALPFGDAHFDLVWTRHVVMNVRDRDRLYRELHRVMKPGGRLAFYDPIAADGAAEPFYPVPWAATGATSTLLTRDQTTDALIRAGFQLVDWDDVTLQAEDWLRRGQSPAVGPTLGMIVGPRMVEMVENFARSLREGRLRLVMATFVAA